MPKVSIIIPCFNQLKYLEEAIDSVKNQSFKNYEIIVVNDGSTELNAIDLINAFAESNIFIIHDVNKGVSAARNKGIMFAKGDYILPLDADDAIHPKFLEEAVEILENNKQIEIVMTGVKYFGSISHEEYLPKYSRRQHLMQNLFFNTSLFRKESFVKVGGYDENFNIGWEDWDFYLRLITSESQIWRIEKSYCLYRIKYSSRNADLVDEKRHLVEQQLYKKYFNDYMYHFPEPLSNLRELRYLTNEKNNFDRWVTELKHSPEYRVGSILLQPVRFLLRNLRKKL